jgi:hypothetical protein
MRYQVQYRKNMFFTPVSGVTNGHDPGHIHFHDRGHVKEKAAYVMIKK